MPAIIKYQLFATTTFLPCPLFLNNVVYGLILTGGTVILQLCTPWSALLPTFWSLSDLTSILRNCVQYLNVELPILVTWLLITTERRSTQFSKALAPILTLATVVPNLPKGHGENWKTPIY